jgi:3-oxoacyl-[acyl-carrier-protein] synthase I
MVVTGRGARTAAGLNTLQAAMAARSVTFEPGGSPFIDGAGQEAGLGSLFAVGRDVIGFDRFVALAGPALRECAHGASAAMPLFLALPPADRPDQLDARFGRPLLEAIAQHAGVALDVEHSVIVRVGHAGFAELVERGARVLADFPAGILLGGVDSAFDQRAVTWLDQRQQLLRLGGTHGRIPGEAAAFLRVELAAENARTKNAARLRGGESEDETQAMARGSALSRVIRRAAGGLQTGSVEWVMSDLNGEPARTDAWLAAEDLVRDVLVTAVHEEVVPHFSDVGAATGPLLAVIAIEWASIGAVRSPNVVIALSSDGPRRGAVAIDLPPPHGDFIASMTAVRDHTVGPKKGSIVPSPREAQHMERVARSLLEDIGSMAMLLAPGPADEQPQESIAQRLFASFDTLAALGTAVASGVSEPDLLAIVDRYETESPEPDRARRFAVSFARSHLAAKTKTASKKR